jgi:exopolysaccharide biosynthesis protein
MRGHIATARRKLSLLLPTVVGTAILCKLPAAHAEDTTTTPYPGVTHIRRVTSNQRIQVVKVDLTRKTIRLRATRPPGGKTVPTFASEYGVHVAINGDFGTRTSPWKTSGLAMGDGDEWSNTADGTLEGFTAIGRDNRVEISPPAEVLGEPEDWMSEIVGGRPLVVDAGHALAPEPPWSRDGCDPHFCYLEPRSAIGLSQDGKTLILATIDGRYTGAAGMTTEQVGALMVEFGAWRAINIDGGGSTTLWIKSEGGVVNQPSDGCCRLVSNHLGVQIVEPYGDLTGFVRHGAIDNEAEPIEGATVSLSSGEAATTDADGRYSFSHLAAGDVTITASATGYADSTVDRYVAAADLTWGSVALLEPDEAPDGGSGGGGTIGDGGAGQPEMGGGCSTSGAASGLPAGLVALSLLLASGRRPPRDRRWSGTSRVE